MAYRRNENRYPWWVKSVNTPTTQTDPKRTERPPLYGLLGRPEIIAQLAVGWKHLKTWIDGATPGRGLPDVALHYAFSSYFTGSAHIEGGFKTTRPEVWKAVKTYVPTPELLGVERWEGSPEEASAMVAHAALHLGAAQVGFAPVEPMWLYPNARIDPDADEPELGDQAWSEKVIPERFRTVVVVAGEVPYAMSRHAPSELGNAADRRGYAGAEMSQVMLVNFITALGYQSIDLPAPTVPFGVAAGLGEMGRMNRLVSPLLGGNIRLHAFLTDLPLAHDTPIDFGLQTFCIRCKKCAEACPPKALSFEDEPTTTVLTAAVLALLVLAAVPAPGHPLAEHDRIMYTLLRWANGVATGDVAAVAPCLHEDLTAFAPGRLGPQTTRETFLEQLVAEGGFVGIPITLRYAFLDVNPEGTKATAQPVVTSRLGNPTALAVTLVKVGDDWQIIRITTDADLPAELVEDLPEHFAVQRVRVHVTDAETGRPVAARVHVRDSRGRYWPPEGHMKNIPTGIRQDVGGDVRLAGTTYAYVEPDFTLSVPTGSYVMEAYRGLEYLPEKMQFDVTSGEAGHLKVELKRWSNARSRGWYSGDTHTHFLDPPDGSSRDAGGGPRRSQHTRHEMGWPGHQCGALYRRAEPVVDSGSAVTRTRA